MGNHGTPAAPRPGLIYDGKGMATLTWTCPNCRRRVPTRVDTCYCGTSRDAAEAFGSPDPGRAASTEIGWDIKALGLGMVVVAVLGVGWLVFGHTKPAPIYPVLGFVDHPPQPSPTPPPLKPITRRPVPPPLFKLPWWK
jgi:hypothetical protein